MSFSDFVICISQNLYQATKKQIHPTGIVLTKSQKLFYADLEPNNAVLELFVDLQRIHICIVTNLTGINTLCTLNIRYQKVVMIFSRKADDGPPLSWI